LASTPTPKERNRPILLNVPESLLAKYDIAASALRYNRTRLILRSLNRDLETTLRHEVFRACNHSRDRAREFGEWP
jgi:hypothetical protein